VENTEELTKFVSNTNDKNNLTTIRQARSNGWDEATVESNKNSSGSTESNTDVSVNPL
jgi:hypothetical protein